MKIFFDRIAYGLVSKNEEKDIKDTRKLVKDKLEGYYITHLCFPVREHIAVKKLEERNLFGVYAVAYVVDNIHREREEEIKKEFENGNRHYDRPIEVENDLMSSGYIELEGEEN